MGPGAGRGQRHRRADRAARAKLTRVAEDVPGSLVVAADVTVAEDRQRIVDATMHRFGRIDVLVNNVGDAASTPAVDTSVEDFRGMVETDLNAVFASRSWSAR